VGPLGLAFSREKSVMIPLKGGLVPGFTAAFGDDRIKSTTETKYLGLHLGVNLDFGCHAAKLLDSSTEVFSRLKSVRKSKWGVSSPMALILYKAVYIPRVTYGASVWYPSVETKKAKLRLESAQRRVLLAVTAGYATVSTRALQVVAGTPPIHLQIEMAIRIHQGMTKIDAENICIAEWQQLWDNSLKGRWTYGFFPDIRTRITTPITFGHYTTQMITGHGDFKSKLHSFTLAVSPQCDCGAEEESAEHILFTCPNMRTQRTKLIEALRSTGVEWPCNRKSFAASRKAWSALETFAKEALTSKEEQRRQERLLHEEVAQDQLP
jgi:hypothetical protein